MRLPFSFTGWRRVTAIAGAGALAIGSAIFAFALPAHAQTGCDVNYQANPWNSGGSQGGFTASVTITNLGSPISGWSLQFDLPSGQGFSQGWSANWSGSSSLTATSMEWNANLGTGSSVEIGFNGTWSGSYSDPTSFSLNGVTCTGQPGNGEEQPPSVSLSSPSAGQQFAQGTDVPLSADASSASSTIDRVEFFVDGDLVGSDSTAPYTVLASGLGQGSYTATAVAYDNNSPQLSTSSSPVSFSVVGQLDPAVVASPSSLTVAEGDSGNVTFTLNQAPGGSVTVSLASTAPVSLSATSVTLTDSNYSTGQSVTVTGDSVGSGTITATAAGHDPATVNVSVTSSGPAPERVPNPYAGADVYVNPDWSEAAQQGGAPASVYNQPTGVWLDRIAAIDAGSAGSNATGLAEHLELARQRDQANGSTPTVIQIVIYNLPGRDCAALASSGELGATEIDRYRTEYIDVIAEIMARPAFSNLRIVAVIEIDSIPNMVTNVAGRDGETEMCNTMLANRNYYNGIGYALATLGAIPNVYNYVDAGHHGWIGWDSNFGPTAQHLLDAATTAGATVNDVHGFITNTANYSALTEPYITVNEQTRNTDWIDWNWYNDELTFAQAFRNELVSLGFNSGIGMLIDTSRNGWGGPNRPSGPSNASDTNQFVEESRIDRRIHKGNWCNQAGAGLGERPQASPATGIHAFVWIKPPGESDGSSREIPNDEGKHFDRMCDPTFMEGTPRNGNSPSGALPDAPVSGHWFQEQFEELLANAWPPL